MQRWRSRTAIANVTDVGRVAGIDVAEAKSLSLMNIVIEEPVAYTSSDDFAFVDESSYLTSLGARIRYMLISLASDHCCENRYTRIDTRIT